MTIRHSAQQYWKQALDCNLLGTRPIFTHQDSGNNCFCSLLWSQLGGEKFSRKKPYSYATLPHSVQTFLSRHTHDGARAGILLYILNSQVLSGEFLCFLENVFNFGIIVPSRNRIVLHRTTLYDIHLLKILFSVFPQILNTKWFMVYYYENLSIEYKMVYGLLLWKFKQRSFSYKGKQLIGSKRRELFNNRIKLCLYS